MCSLISDLHCLHFHSGLKLNNFFILQRKSTFSQWNTTTYLFGTERVKEKNCAKLFWNPSINIEFIVRTNPDGRMQTHWSAVVMTTSCSMRKGSTKMILLTHSHTMTPFDARAKWAFCRHCGKRRNCSLRAISPFPTVFSTCLYKFLPFSSNLNLSSANSFSLEESKICHLVMG